MSKLAEVINPIPGADLAAQSPLESARPIHWGGRCTDLRQSGALGGRISVALKSCRTQPKAFLSNSRKHLASRTLERKLVYLKRTRLNCCFYDNARQRNRKTWVQVEIWFPDISQRYRPKFDFKVEAVLEFAQKTHV